MADQASGGRGTDLKDQGRSGGRAGTSNRRSVAGVMSPDPVAVSSDSAVLDAARMMRELDIGAVLVMDGDRLKGVVTDRDITVRAVAEERDVARTPVSDIASHSLTTVSPDDTLDRVAEIMRSEALRRLVVVQGGRPVGIVSLGDLALTDEAAEDAAIALTDISAAPADQ